MEELLISSMVMHHIKTSRHMIFHESAEFVKYILLFAVFHESLLFYRILQNNFLELIKAKKVNYKPKNKFETIFMFLKNMSTEHKKITKFVTS